MANETKLAKVVLDGIAPVTFAECVYLNDGTEKTIKDVLSGDNVGGSTTLKDVFLKDLFNKESFKIAFLGDSITWGYAWENRYSNLVANKIKQYVSNTTYINVAVSGATSQKLIDNQLNNACDSSYDYCFIMIGINDSLNSIPKDTLLSNLKYIVNKLKEYKVKPILLSTCPGVLSFDTSRLYRSGVIATINNIVASTNDCYFINIHQKAIEYMENTGVNIDSLMKDSVHPNENGHSLIAKWIIEELGMYSERN